MHRCTGTSTGIATLHALHLTRTWHTGVLGENPGDTGRATLYTFVLVTRTTDLARHRHAPLLIVRPAVVPLHTTLANAHLQE